MTRPHITTPAELSSLRDLELATRATVEGLRQGLHRSPFHGYSAEFNQYRHYRPGDDLKYVDWKAFGRTDRLFTRQFRETTNLSALFVVDVSRSMDFGDKFRLAQSVTAVLGTLIIDQGDLAGVVADGRLSARAQSDGPRVAGNAIDEAGAAPAAYLPPRSGHRQLAQFLAIVARLRPEGTAGIAAGLDRAASLLHRRGLVVAVSDFYDDAQALTALRRLARRGHEMIVVQTLSADEVRLPQMGVVELVDAETGRGVVVEAERARADYETRIARWLDGFETAVRREGLGYVRVVTGEPLERALRLFLVSRRSAA